MDLGHGSFETSLPRRPVLVTTGRLTGNAPDLYRDYNQRGRQRGEPELLLWDRDELLGRFSRVTQTLYCVVLLTDSSWLGRVCRPGHVDDVEHRGLLKAMDGVGAGAPGGAWRDRGRAPRRAPEGQLGRLDLACHTALCLVAGALAASATASAQGEFAAAAAGDLFEAYALELRDRCDDRLLQEFSPRRAEWPVELAHLPGWCSVGKSWAYLRFACEPQTIHERTRLRTGYFGFRPPSQGLRIRLVTSTR